MRTPRVALVGSVAGRSWIATGAFALGILLTGPTAAMAVTRTCGADPVLNTTNVLCASPSGPCNGTSVTMSNDIEVTAGGCTFDLGGRTLSIQKNFQMIGSGFITVINAGNITVTGTGRLKARGDFGQPAGTIIRGGLVSLTSSGFITLLDRAQIDVSGDSAGTVRLTAAGANASGYGVDLQNGAEVQGIGISVADEGERYADGGALDINVTTGSVYDHATVNMSGANQAQGGAVDIRAARDVTIDETMDLTGGGSDGGAIDVVAGDNITISKQIDADSRAGGGFGGIMSFSAGLDAIGGIVTGGAFTLNNVSLELNGSDAETFGGDGGELEITTKGLLRMVGTQAAIRASGGVLFDGSGGTLFFSSGDGSTFLQGPLDGDINLQGDVRAKSGGLNGDGGVLEMSAGRDFTSTATINMDGKDTGGDIAIDAGGSILVNGTVDANATNATGEGGFVDLVAGLARVASLTVSKDVTADGGANNGGGQTISLAGCTVTVSDNIKVRGRGGVSGLGTPGGSDIEIISRGVAQLRAGSQYLATPGGTVVTTHPPGQNPVIGSGVLFQPPRTDNATLTGFFPNCPLCGDNVKQLGEGCDDGDLTGGDGCSATCTVETGWSCTGSPSVCTPVCGDGAILGGEQCDDHNVTSGDGCDANCTFTGCGNGVITAGELCDDGDTSSGDGCSASCLVESGYVCTGQPSVCVGSCGDGVVTGGEQCDDHNLISGDGCDANCTFTGCGNGIITAGEQCEDGNTQNGDCCSASCVFESAGSTCATDGNLCTNDVCNGGGACVHPPNTAPCNDNNACTTADVCAGGICTGGPALSCDDGNVCTNDGCSASIGCTHAANTVVCDDGAFCTVNDRCAATVCSGTARDCSDTSACTADSCNETSDQCVNNPAPLNGTACSDGQFCTVSDTCQAGVCSGGPRDCSGVSNSCNDGVCNETTDVCAPQAKPNGTVCSDGNVCTISDMCMSGSCQGNPMTCGDGTTQGTCGESCDDGNAINGDGCDTNCTPTGCGNRILTAGEQCDDGGVTAGDGCSATCGIEPGWTCNGQPSSCTEICGDGIQTPGEQCDDSNTLPRDGCSPSCDLELCGLAPATGCRRPFIPAKASVVIKDGVLSDGDSINWKWIKGAATGMPDFGSPTFLTSYAICVYDESGPTPVLKLTSTAQPGGFCGSKSCWRSKTTGFTYSTKSPNSQGITKIILKAGLDGSAKINVKGKGGNLLLPSLSALGQPTRIQVRNSAGLCWEAIYSAPATKHTSEQFKDKAD